jgi:signal transduction histidine kinase
MSVSRIISAIRSHAPTEEERAVFKVQIPLFFAVSVLLTLAYYGQRELKSTVVDREHVQVLVRGWDGFAWFVWLLAAPAILLLIRRFPLAQGQVRRSLRGLLLGSLGIYLVVSNLRFALRILPNVWLPDSADLPIDWEHYKVAMLYVLPADFLAYACFFSASFAINYYFKYHQRAEEALQLQLSTVQLQSDLARAELTTLRGQLHPHFLFNSFNAVASLVRQRRNEAAVEIIVQLSALLRVAIERTGRQELSLEEEVDFIRRYLEIERVRFGEKLQLDFAVEAAALGGAVPNLVLQPLVENAIKHGISLRTRPGSVRLAARRIKDRLQLEIVNDGPEGPPSETEASGSRHGGIGLANTRARLEKLYGRDYRLDLTPFAEGGMRLNLDLPWRPAASYKPTP